MGEGGFEERQHGAQEAEGENKQLRTCVWGLGCQGACSVLSQPFLSAVGQQFPQACSCLQDSPLLCGKKNYNRSIHICICNPFL